MAQTHPPRGVRAIPVLSVLSFGLLTGAMLLIGISIVGFWKSLAPSEFVSWFATHSNRLGLIMIPLGVITVLVSLAAVAVSWRSRSGRLRWAVIAAKPGAALDAQKERRAGEFDSLSGEAVAS